MTEEYKKLLRQVLCYTESYLENISQTSPFPDQNCIDELKRFHESLPITPSDPMEVMELLNQIGGKGTTAQIGGRYFGFVNGGLLPVSHAAQWLTDTWNQNSALYLMSPIASVLEQICEQWLIELLNLDINTAAGLVTGSSNAIICALTAARNHILRKQGYDVVEHGMRGAPPIRIIVNEQAHSSIWSALSILGIGKQEVIAAPVDGRGSICVEKLPMLNENTLLIIQAGNVTGGAFDPIDQLCDQSNLAKTWVHIDGAFGLWAAASRKYKKLVTGLEKADSYSVDCHKTLNAGYDCGIVLCKNRKALMDAMHATGSYIQYSKNRDGMLYTTEMSRRARSVVLWATLKQLGRSGVENLIDALGEKAEYFANGLEKAGFVIINPVSFNQFICKCNSPELTQKVLGNIQNSGVCWCSGGKWDNEPIIRVSVCSHATTFGDIDKSISAFVSALKSSNIQ